MIALLLAAALAVPPAPEAPRAWRWPADDGAHPQYPTEWWYFAGSLPPTEAGGDTHAFHLAFFRRTVSPDTSGRTSRWAARDIYLAHLSLTNERTGERFTEERAGRDAFGMASAATDTFDVRLEPWRAFRFGSLDRYRLQVVSTGAVFDLPLGPLSPRVLHGDGGLVAKGDTAFSHYVSIPRMGGVGVVRIGSRTHTLRGHAWFDHEFMNAARPAGVVGWDWFGLHLDDGASLMIYLLRRPDGTWTPFSGGTHLSVDSTVTHLAAADIEVDVLHHWESPRSRATYPAGWRLRVPRLGIDVEARPIVADQEFVGRITGLAYWEGVVALTGTHTGRGFAELTGYAPGGDLPIR